MSKVHILTNSDFYIAQAAVINTVRLHQIASLCCSSRRNPKTTRTTTFGNETKGWIPSRNQSANSNHTLNETAPCLEPSQNALSKRPFSSRLMHTLTEVEDKLYQNRLRYELQLTIQPFVHYWFGEQILRWVLATTAVFHHTYCSDNLEIIHIVLFVNSHSVGTWCRSLHFLGLWINGWWKKCWVRRQPGLEHPSLVHKLEVMMPGLPSSQDLDFGRVMVPSLIRDDCCDGLSTRRCWHSCVGRVVHACANLD